MINLTSKAPGLKQLAMAMTLLAPTTALADWTGGYAGLSLGTLIDSEVSAAGIVGESNIDYDSVIGAFAGYQIQVDSFVFGAEIGVDHVPDGKIGDDDFQLDREFRTIDLKGRAGYDLGQTLVYGVAGFSNLQAFGDFEGEDTATGFNLGLGVDYRISDSVTVGAEYLARRTVLEEEGLEFDIDVDNLSLRAAFQF